MYCWCCSAATLTVEDVASLRHFSRDQIKLTMFLGSGAFGEVFEGVATNILSETSGCTKVAVKVRYHSCQQTRSAVIRRGEDV